MNGFKNSEGYSDPTPHAALKNIVAEKWVVSRPPFRPLVYICSPYSGDVEANTEKTECFCRFALDQGNIPIAPHLMFPRFMNDDDPAERDLAIFMGIVLMGKCQEVWVLGDAVSAGMQKEIDKAHIWRRRIRWFTPDFMEVQHL